MRVNADDRNRLHIQIEDLDKRMRDEMSVVQDKIAKNYYELDNY